MFIAFINSASVSGARSMRECKIRYFQPFINKAFLPRAVQEEEKTHEGYILMNKSKLSGKHKSWKW